MSVILIDSMGDDLRIVNAARVSYNKRSSYLFDYRCGACQRVFQDIKDMSSCTSGWLSGGEPCGRSPINKRLKDADTGVIRYMIQNSHGTPFEHVVMTFLVQTSIGVMREMQRHRFCSFNEMSTRYTEMPSDFGFPQIRTQVGKPGHYTFEPCDNLEAIEWTNFMRDSFNRSYDDYRDMIAGGVAKEVARSVLPLGLMTEAYMTINLRSLFNFLSLRLHPTALKEIRDLSQEIYDLTQPIVPVAVNAWEKYGRPNGDSFHDCDSCDYHLGEVA